MVQQIKEEYLVEHRISGYGQTFKALCPECGGHNLYTTLNNGIAHCFNCLTTFKTDFVSQGIFVEKELDVNAIRLFYDKLSTEYTGRLGRDHREYLKRRGIEDTGIQSFRLGFCPQETIKDYFEPIAEDAGITDRRHCPVLANRYTIPYLSDDVVIDIRGRAALAEMDPKYKSCKYSSYARGAILPFNWDAAYKIAREKKYLLITEGEIKAIVAHLQGFPCVALPGMTSWRIGLKPELDWKCIFIFDSSQDRQKSREIDRAIRNAAERLLNPFVIRLPLFGEDKMDLDAFLLHPQGGAQKLEHFIQDALHYSEYQKLRSF